MHLVTTHANDALSRIRQSPEMWSTGRTKMIIFCSRLVCTHRAGPPLRVWLFVSLVFGIRTMQLFNSRQKVEVFISGLVICIITDGECQVKNYEKVSNVSRDTKNFCVAIQLFSGRSGPHQCNSSLRLIDKQERFSWSCLKSSDDSKGKESQEDKDRSQEINL